MFGRVGSVLCACVDVVAGEGISFLLTCLAGALLPWSLTPPPLFSPLPSPQALASFLFKAECVRESCVCRVHGKTTTKQKQKTRASRAIDDDDECRSAELGCAPKKSSNTPAVCFAPQDARWIHRKWSIRDLGPSASLPRARAAAAGLGRAAQAKRRSALPLPNGGLQRALLSGFCRRAPAAPPSPRHTARAYAETSGVDTSCYGRGRRCARRRDGALIAAGAPRRCQHTNQPNLSPSSMLTPSPIRRAPPPPLAPDTKQQRDPPHEPPNTAPPPTHALERDRTTFRTPFFSPTRS